MLRLFRKTYKSRREAEIELFFRYVNWYKLLRAWGLFSTFQEALPTVYDYRSKADSIKRVWKTNLNKTLPEILNLMGILPLKYTKANVLKTDWYFSTITDLFEQMHLPNPKDFIKRDTTYIFSIKRKTPIYTIKV